MKIIIHLLLMDSVFQVCWLNSSMCDLWDILMQENEIAKSNDTLHNTWSLEKRIRADFWDIKNVSNWPKV